MQSMWDKQRWLARLSYSFIIVALVLAWEAYRLWRAGEGALRNRILVYLVCAVLAALIGAAGVRARHRSDD